MTIYSSDKAVPYVYICTHKDTNQFYIGYREKNVKLNIPSHLDLPEYKTSSKIVNPDWSNYTWTIVAEFFDPSHAYTFEQQLIFDNWKNPLLLNGRYHLGEDKQFRNSGPHSAETKQKMSDAKKGKTRSAESRQKQSESGKGVKRSPRSAEHKQKLSDAGKGKPSPRKGIPSGKKGIPSGRKGIPTWNKGISHSDETKQKISGAKAGKLHPKVECPHCGMVGGVSNMKRYHFEHCKKRSIHIPH